MSESVKPRFAVDLNEIERHLAQAGSPHVQPAAAPRSNDPLAELARIVGQDDPFQAILANDGAARPRQQPSAIDDLFVARDTVTPAARRPQAQARSTEFDLGGYAPQSEAPRSNGQAYAYQQPAPAQQQASYNEAAYADEYYDDGVDAYADNAYAQPERLDYPPVEKPRSRKGLVAIGAVVGAIVIGGGGAYVLTKPSTGASGEPILVQATTDPVKVQPQNPGGVDIPNQNKQIYERAQQTETKVVNREEQPVDVKQAVRSTAGAVADATGATVPGAPGHARNAPNSLNLGEPRKVRTVTIRPDGSVVGAPEPAPAASPVPAMTMPAAATAQPAAVQTASAQPKPVAAPATPAATPKPAPAAATPVAATPAATPAPQKVASTQPVPVAAPAATADTVTSGGYAVQLGLANSEDAAASAFASYQRKYPDLAGATSLIRKAEVNGNTIYRIRVGPMSREEASSLCSKLQGQGGQCFVAKN
ncbi:SPOR domain-containing protein [Microvirga sp. G4-2]|uniref:SPOR domain-containing protein n=1 Tax=Microvirga sp. G4-2 TaxID=3434467 RepID=UPI0040439576